MNYESFIGLRYLKARRKQTFISIITIISIAGVMVGVMALIVVLSVMSGFENDLKEKIMGVNSHVVVLKYNGG
ncbi:MAG: lipoprotein-releasing system transmembrane subunit LolC, partial [Deltaproteobacteria bacterium]|nr:lipoprotein-releasing system transmembrane subunit LolC [Deltaproteobacteria bacterium]